MRFRNGLPRQCAHWLAMTGFFDSLKGRTCVVRPLYFVGAGRVRRTYTYYTTFYCKFRLFPRIDGSGELWYFGIVVGW